MINTDIDIKVKTRYDGYRVDLDDAIIDLYNRMEQLSYENMQLKAYVDNIKKILPWVPDENGEFK